MGHSRHSFALAAIMVIALLGLGTPALAHFAVSEPDKPDCDIGQVRQIGEGKAQTMPSASSGFVPLNLATRLVLPAGWTARIDRAMGDVPVHWETDATWVNALTSAKQGCYTVDWKRKIFVAGLRANTANEGEGFDSQYYVFSLAPGSLKTQIEEWGAKQGHNINWSGRDFSVQRHIVLSGSLEDVIKKAFAVLDSTQNVGVAVTPGANRAIFVTVKAPPAERYALHLEPGSLKHQLDSWAQSHHMQFSWLPSHDYLLEVNASYYGTREQILQRLSFDLHNSGVMLDIRYKSGNRTIIIKGD